MLCLSAGSILICLPSALPFLSLFFHFLPPFFLSLVFSWNYTFFSSEDCSFYCSDGQTIITSLLWCQLQWRESPLACGFRYRGQGRGGFIEEHVVDNNGMGSMFVFYHSSFLSQEHQGPEYSPTVSPLSPRGMHASHERCRPPCALILIGIWQIWTLAWCYNWTYLWQCMPAFLHVLLNKLPLKSLIYSAL